MPKKIPCISYKHIKRCEIDGILAQVPVGTIIFVNQKKGEKPKGFAFIDEKVYGVAKYPELTHYLINIKKLKKNAVEFQLAEVFSEY